MSINSIYKDKKSTGSAFRGALNATGARLTSQRSVIMDIIQRSDKHLDANEIFHRAATKIPRLSLATVYRTLNKLKELGIIEELSFHNDHHHYEAKSDREHHHLVCLDCGKITEFQYPLSKHISGKVAEAKGFKIIDTEVRISGYCSKCLRKHNAANTGRRE